MLNVSTPHTCGFVFSLTNFLLHLFLSSPLQFSFCVKGQPERQVWVSKIFWQFGNITRHTQNCVCTVVAVVIIFVTGKCHAQYLVSKWGIYCSCVNEIFNKVFLALFLFSCSLWKSCLPPKRTEKKKKGTMFCSQCTFNKWVQISVYTLPVKV